MSATASPVTRTRTFNETIFDLRWDSLGKIGFDFEIIEHVNANGDEISSGMFIAEIHQGGPASNAGMTENYLGYQIIGINSTVIEGSGKMLQRLFLFTKARNKPVRLRLRHIHSDEYARRPYDTGLEFN